MDAKKRLRQELSGAAVARLLSDIGGLALTERRRAGGEDFDRRNRARLRELERAVQTKKREDAAPKPRPFRLREFEGVPARVDTRGTKGARELGAATGAPQKAAGEEDHGVCPCCAAGCRARAACAQGRPAVDYVGLNAARAKETPLKSGKGQSNGRTASIPTFPGQIPAYLTKRKDEWAREERRREEELAERRRIRAIPPGFAVMPEEERLETLEYLRRKQDRLIDELSRMPIVVDTLAMKARRRRIEGTLDELEKALDHFSRPPVYVPIVDEDGERGAEGKDAREGQKGDGRPALPRARA
ncbi:calmodulin-binding-domain-containing protein [Hyaloraphidium curvatum]|nr:calmodulin-binding-domain-containing protein [Hyaloraphidium curvatum]